MDLGKYVHYSNFINNKMALIEEHKNKQLGVYVISGIVIFFDLFCTCKTEPINPLFSCVLYKLTIFIKHQNIDFKVMKH